MIDISRYHFQDIMRKMLTIVAAAAIGSTFLYTYGYLRAQDVGGPATPTSADAALGDVVSRFSSTSDVLPESNISFSGQNYDQLEWKNSLMFNQEQLDILYSAVNARPAPGTIVAGAPGEALPEDKVTVDETGKVTFLDGKVFGTINEAGIVVDPQGNAVGRVDTTGAIFDNNNEYLGKDPRKQPALAGTITAPSYYLNSVLFYQPQNWTLWMNYKRTRRGMKMDDLKVAHIQDDFVEFIWQPKDLDFISPGWQSKLVPIDPKVVSTRLGKPITQKELDAMATAAPGEASISMSFGDTPTSTPVATPGATPVPTALPVPGAPPVPLTAPALIPSGAPSATPAGAAVTTPAIPGSAALPPTAASMAATPDALLSTLNPQAGEPSATTAGAVPTAPVASNELPALPPLAAPAAPADPVTAATSREAMPLEMPALPGADGSTSGAFSIQLELPPLPKNIDIPVFSTKKLEQALLLEKQKRDELANIEIERQKEIAAAIAAQKKAEEERLARLKLANQEVDESAYVWAYKSKDGNILVDRFKKAVKFRVGLNQTFISNKMEVVEGYAPSVEITPPTETGRQGTQIPVQSLESEIFAPGTYPAGDPNNPGVLPDGTAPTAPAGAPPSATPAPTTPPASSVNPADLLAPIAPAAPSAPTPAAPR